MLLVAIATAATAAVASRLVHRMKPTELLRDDQDRPVTRAPTGDSSSRWEDGVVDETQPTPDPPERGLPDRARVVIIGGGVIGCSVAYHLAKRGWTDVVLLERDQLTSGTTWHAAGLIVSGGMTTETLAWMTKYSTELYARLEEETGHSTGFTPVGYVQTASNAERMGKLRREADFLRLMGIEREEIGQREVADLWPLIDASDVIGGFYTASEGRADPYNVALSLAAGARALGVRIVQRVPVTGITRRGGRVAGVVTPEGEIEAEYVVNCAGMWARQVGALAGVSVPLQAVEHAYLITEPLEGVSPDLPIFEDPDRFAYYREETGGLMVGLFEPVAAPWSVEAIPADFSFGEIPSDWDRLTPFLEYAMEILPRVADAGVRKLFTGPESFTPDNGFLMGQAPELDNFFVAAGFNSLGILTGGGAGSIMASWIADGLPPVDVTTSTSPDCSRGRPVGRTSQSAASSCSGGCTRPDHGRTRILDARAACAGRRCMTVFSGPALGSRSRPAGRMPPTSPRPTPRSTRD